MRTFVIKCLKCGKEATLDEYIQSDVEGIEVYGGYDGLAGIACDCGNESEL